MKNIFLFILAITFNSIWAQEKSKDISNEPDPPLIKTQHKVTVNGQVISYTATTGFMMLREENGKPKAKMFFIAYTVEGTTGSSGTPGSSKRPLTFSFNGGPGSSSVWLHMGALGPKRIEMTDFGAATQPPYKVVDNEFSWLDQTDLVFIDPVMTGYSRPADGVDKKEFTGFTEDIESVGQFIYMYTTRFERWNSPKFLVGESYGTTRASGLSGHLQDRYGMYLNGIVLVSSIMNFQTARFTKGNDLPFILFLPTYSAIAWFHKQLDPSITSLKPFLDEVEKFAMNEYTLLLMKGDKLTAEEKTLLAQKLSRYTGLSGEYIHQTNYRIGIGRFVKQLRRDEGITVGRLDGRFSAMDYDDASENYEFDPSYDKAIYGPYTMAINDHIRKTLKFQSDLPYEILTGRVRPWNYNNVQNEFLNTAETLRQAMHKNPSLKVLICNGYYDLATPYFATDYTVNHMFVDSSLRNNIRQTFYEAGHMMYIHRPSLIQMKKNVADFYKDVLK